MQGVEKSIRVMAPVGEVSRYWRNFAKFPQFMENVKSVEVTGDDSRSHGVLKGPLGLRAEFDASIVKDIPDKTICWSSDEGTMGCTGAVTFSEPDYNTEVHVVIQWYDPRAGPIGKAVSRLLQNPEKMLEEDLQRFKHVVEARDANVVGTKSGTSSRSR